MSKLYYTPPPDEAFEDMKTVATSIWLGGEKFDLPKREGSYGYIDEKLECIDRPNVGGNFMYILAMFHQLLQERVISRLDERTVHEVVIRLRAGGADEGHITNLVLSHPTYKED